jgi:Ni,Fe-hydrogenase I cytochrome b subunit
MHTITFNGDQGFIAVLLAIVVVTGTWILSPILRPKGNNEATVLDGVIMLIFAASLVTLVVGALVYVFSGPSS